MIDIQNLSYRYAGSKELVFDGFSLQLSETTSTACWARTAQARVHYYI